MLWLNHLERSVYLQHLYPTGDVPEPFFDRLVALVEEPFMESPGFHVRNLDSCDSTQDLRSPLKFRYQDRLLWLGSSDIIVPTGGTAYWAPSLILHYIQHHKYRPPECFQTAVLECPEPNSPDYFAAIKRVVPEFARRFGG
jgi:hypothetical protein